MKYGLISTSLFSLVAMAVAAPAADMAPALSYDWSGFYLGANAGAAWNNSSIDTTVSIPGNPGYEPLWAEHLDLDQTNFTGGVEVGYNWQHDNIVLGVEADINYLGFDQSLERLTVTGDVSHLSAQTEWFGTLRGRLGFAADKLLLFGTGGLAYGEVKGDARISDLRGFDYFSGSGSNVNWGWTLGAGMEYGIDENWSLGAEYLYVDLGNADFDYPSLTDPTASGSANLDVSFSVLRATLKYNF